MGEIIFMAIIMVICGLGFAESFSWRVLARDNSGGAAFWPRIVMIALFACCLLRIIAILRDKEAQRRKFVFLDLFYGHRGVFLLSLVIYAFTIQYLGFLVSTIIFLNVIVNILYKFSTNKFGTPAQITIRTVCLCLSAYAVYYFFGTVLHIMVPTGVFGI